jgi:chromosome segregation ATPase
MDAKRDASHYDTESRSSVARLKHMKSELEQSKKQQQQSDVEYKRMKTEDQKLQKELKAQTEELGRMEFSEERFHELTDKRRSLQGQIRNLEQQISTRRMNLQQLEFQYEAPAKFDRSKVCN